MIIKFLNIVFYFITLFVLFILTILSSETPYCFVYGWATIGVGLGLLVQLKDFKTRWKNERFYFNVFTWFFNYVNDNLLIFNIYAF